MRRVLAKIWNKEKREHEAICGFFHCWGEEYEEFESGPGNRTMAIIELEKGRIVMASPRDVTFLDECIKP